MQYIPLGSVDSSIVCNKRAWSYLAALYIDRYRTQICKKGKKEPLEVMTPPVAEGIWFT